jgi:diguanylate cyclase (GGDEF)-like protein/PAS domain S-box-containing protein
LANRIVQREAGDAQFSQEVILLPKIPQHHAGEMGMNRLDRDSGGGDAGDKSSRPKLLVVDDTPANLKLVVAVLARLHLDVLTASSGAEALTLVGAHEFVAILLDVRMPGMDGYETADRVRALTSDNPVPIIFLTASQREEKHILQGYGTGAIDYLIRPIDNVLLLSKVRVLLTLFVHRRELSETSRTLRRANQRLNRLLQAVGDGIVGIDGDGRINMVNPAASRLMECSPSELLGGDAQAFFPLRTNDGHDAFARARASGIYRNDEALFCTRSGREFPAEYSLSLIEGDVTEPATFALVFENVSERKHAAERLRTQAELDHMTGLANRLLFERTLDTEIAAAERAGRHLALLYMDLDNFKAINDQHGHAFGDEMLKCTARRLQGAVRAGDMCARLGGDEFAVLLSDVADIAPAESVAQKIVVTVSEPFACGGVQLAVGASVGVALYPTDGRSAEALIRAADRAMYLAKRNDTKKFFAASAELGDASGA